MATSSKLSNLNETPITSGVSSRQPKNINQLNVVSYRLVFSRMPEVEYNCTSIIIPSVTLGGPTVMPTRFSDDRRPGDKVDFDILTIEFIIDEDLNNYREVYNWILGLGFPDNHGQYQQLDEELSDIKLITLTNNSRANVEFSFKDCFPTILGQIDFTATAIDLDPIICSASFAFSGSFDINNVT